VYAGTVYAYIRQNFRRTNHKQRTDASVTSQIRNLLIFMRHAESRSACGRSTLFQKKFKKIYGINIFYFRRCLRGSGENSLDERNAVYNKKKTTAVKSAVNYRLVRQVCVSVVSCQMRETLKRFTVQLVLSAPRTVLWNHILHL
jgi:hypothetical protein